MITSPSEACRLRAAEKLWSIAERASMREGARREPSQGRANPKDDVPVNLAERIIAARMRLREEQERRRKEQNRKTGAEQGDV
jgi:hypothetical protein